MQAMNELVPVGRVSGRANIKALLSKHAATSCRSALTKGQETKFGALTLHPGGMWLYVCSKDD
jgi:hypothetical protein